MQYWIDDGSAGRLISHQRLYQLMDPDYPKKYKALHNNPKSKRLHAIVSERHRQKLRATGRWDEYLAKQSEFQKRYKLRKAGIK